MKKLRIFLVSSIDPPGLFRRSKISLFLPLPIKVSRSFFTVLSVPNATSRYVRSVAVGSSFISATGIEMTARIIVIVFVSLLERTVTTTDVFSFPLSLSISSSIQFVVSTVTLSILMILSCDCMPAFSAGLFEMTSRIVRPSLLSASSITPMPAIFPSRLCWKR